MSKRKKEGAHFSFYAQWTLILQKSLIIAIRGPKGRGTKTNFSLPYPLHPQIPHNSITTLGPSGLDLSSVETKKNSNKTKLHHSALAPLHTRISYCKG